MRLKAIIGWTACGVFFSVVFGFWSVIDYYNTDVKSEYQSARVIQMVEEFVIRNNGRWPKSWTELIDAQTDGNTPDTDFLRKYTIVDFSITSDQLLNDPELIYRSIVPAIGEYGFYPYARRDLEQLLQAIRDAHSPNNAQPQSSASMPNRLEMWATFQNLVT
jgi:hypothetical protein